MRGPRLSHVIVAVTLLAAYVVFAFVLGSGYGGERVGLVESYLVLGASALVIGLGGRLLRRFGALPSSATAAVVLSAASILVALLAVDTFFDLRARRERAATTAREPYDPALDSLQLRPRRYYPTGKNFTIYKPDFQSVGWTYGDLVSPALRQSPTLMSSVLERRRVATSIDAHGFRETTPLDEATVLALGDSYVQAPTLSQELTWPKVLESLTGVAVYNLGVDRASPAQELWLLEHVLTTMRPRKARRVLWMIFEGNDLEDDFDHRLPPAPPVFPQTLVGSLMVGAPTLLHDGSVLRQVLDGGFHRARTPRHERFVDGVSLPWPLWTSPRFGRAFAFPLFVFLGAMPAAYVERHPNWPAIERVFADMKRLATAHGLEVTVVLAPTFPRLYGHAFGHGDAMSAEPHFLRFVERLAKTLGYPVVNLADLLRPHAEEELLYFRDDTHWNARGNRVVAELIAGHAFPR